MPAGSSFDNSAKEQIKQAVDIVDLVGDYIPLRREGRGYKGICPWHDDSRPSLQVNPDRQSFKCWVCDIGGDIFSFVMKHEGVEFREALTILAQRAGITLTPSRPGASGIEPDQKSLLYEVLAWAEQQFHDFLMKAPEAEPARKYIQSRQLTPDSVKRFHIGYSPDAWDWLLQKSRTTKFNAQLLETAGLVRRRANGPGHYDWFRGRLLFSIRDPQGRPVGFGGRVVPGVGQADAAKYVNSPDTPLFTKHKLLYGMDVAKDAIHKSRLAVVMEGYTDCIVARQCGFGESMAVLGTALGEKHVKLLRPLADKIVLVLDGDDAGQRRTNEVLELFLAENVDLRVATPPDDLDPADFLLRNPPAAFQAMLDGAADALTHAFRTFTAGVNPEDVHAMSHSLEQVLSIIARAPRLRDDTSTAIRLREEKILNRLAFLFRIDEIKVRERLSELRRKTKWKSPAEEATEQQQREPLDAWDRHLLELLLQAPDMLDEVLAAVPPRAMRSATGRLVLSRCRDVADTGAVPDFDRLMLECDEPDLKSIIVELDEQGRAKQVADAAGSLRHLLDRLQDKLEQRQRQQEKLSLRESGADEAAQSLVLARLIEQKRSRQGISGPTDG
ncbi:MAG: DNA primase [Pirellulales bacterium]